MNSEHQEIPRIQDPTLSGEIIKEPSSDPKGVIPLQDLDDEPDMMKEESDTPSEAVSEPDLEWQAEPVNQAVSNTVEAAGNMRESPVVEHEGQGKVKDEEEDEGFEHGTPLNYYGDEDAKEQELVIPEGCVRIEYQPQPKPPSPIEVSDVETLSPPPQSPPLPPPPPPPDNDEDGEIPNEERDEGVGQEFPSPPPELLPSPPPELLPSPPPELTNEFQK